MEYLDIQFMNLTEDDIALKKAAHKFAEEVMRPVAKELDTMSAADVVADGSPLWLFLKKAYELGYHKTLLPEYYGGLGLSPLQIHIVFEELAWGSFGLSIQLGVIAFPFYVACWPVSGAHRELCKTVLRMHRCKHQRLLGHHGAGPWLGLHCHG